MSIEKLVKRPDPTKNVMSNYYSQIENLVVPGGPAAPGYVPDSYREPEALYDFINKGDTARALATLEANAGNPALLGAMVGLCRERSGMTLGKFSTRKDVVGTAQRLAEIVGSYKGYKYTLFEMAYHTHAPTVNAAGTGLSTRTRRNRRKNSRSNSRSNRRR